MQHAVASSELEPPTFDSSVAIVRNEDFLDGAIAAAELTVFLRFRKHKSFQSCYVPSRSCTLVRSGAPQRETYLNSVKDPV